MNKGALKRSNLCKYSVMLEAEIEPKVWIA